MPGCGRLETTGVREEAHITNRINRGGFMAVFLLQVLSAIGSKELRLD
ncbi:DUF6471 domain-containing protein [Microvirga massiliensis]|nr:DUF6471 domain-containing protein [Microvirga massiliensis]